MRKHFRQLLLLGAFTLLVALIVAISPFVSSSSYASSYVSWTGHTIAASNVRTGPGTGYGLVATYPPDTNVTVYASVRGQVVWGGISTWYRISSLSSSPRYIYGGLIVSGSESGGGGGSPSPVGKVIVVSLSHQWLYAYQNGKEVFNAAVMTGRPALPTPAGTYHVFAKLHPTTFYSPWPSSSPYWYPPTYINYALEFREGGFFLHDSWWHSVYGPGTNGWHYDPKYGWQWGSHGCVAMPYSAAAWLYNWAPIGTTVVIRA